MFSRRTGRLDEMLVTSNSAYGQDGWNLSVVKNLCCGGNPLGAFGLVCLGGVFREDVFSDGGGCFFEYAEEISG